MSHLQGETFSHVASQTYVQSCLFQYMIRQQGCCRLAVASSDANQLRLGIASGKFKVGNHRSSLTHKLYNKRSVGTDTRTFDYLACMKNLFLGMMAFFVVDAVFNKHSFILFLDCPVIGNEHFETFFFCENSGTHATFSSTKNDDEIIFSHYVSYRNFNVTNVSAANIRAINQKRATILDSGIPFF